MHMCSRAAGPDGLLEKLKVKYRLFSFTLVGQLVKRTAVEVRIL